MNTSIQEYRSPFYENANVMIMENIPEFDTEDYDLFNEKEFKKYINDIEGLVRRSMEYQIYIQYIRLYMDMNRSPFLEHATNIETTKIRIEIHHTPFTLFDIVMTVFNKRSRTQEPLEVELVALEVAYLHYFLYVGLVPLSKTEHLLVHNQELFVPLDHRLLGRYEEFIEMYKQDIPEDAMERYNIQKELTKTYNETKNTQILQVAPTYLQMPNGYGLPQLEQIKSLAQDRLQQLTSSNTYKGIETEKYNNTNEKIKPFTIGDEYRSR